MNLPFAWPETSQLQKASRTDFVNEDKKKLKKLNLTQTGGESDVIGTGGQGNCYGGEAQRHSTIELCHEIFV